MPIYEYQGQQYEMSETDPIAAKNKILAHLGQQQVPQQQAEEPSMLGMGSPVQRIAKGAIVDPTIALAQMAVGAIPGETAAGIGQKIQEFGAGVEAKTQAGREQRGSEGMDFYQLLGNVLGSAAPASLLAKLGTGAKAAAATGALTSVGTQPVLEQGADLWTEKAKQAGIGAVGGAVGQKLVAGLGRVLAPVTGEAEATVRATGTVPTIGESLGGLPRKIEDFIAGVPVLGEFVKDAKLRSIAQWNKGTIDKALSKLPTVEGNALAVPENVVGGDAVAFANQAISKSYDDLYSKMSYTLGNDTNNKLVALTKSKALTPDQQAQVQKALDSFLYSKLDTPLAGSTLTNAPSQLSTIEGSAMKGIESDLKGFAYSLLKKTQGQTADDVRVGEALLDVVGTLKKDFYKQNAKTVNVKDLLNLDKAYSEMAVITDASARAEAGLFTPTQLSQASKANARKVSTRAFGEGRAVLQKDAQAAKEVLGDGKSGLVARIGGLGALGVGAAAGLPATLATVGGVAGIYSKTGQKLLDKLIAERPGLFTKIGEQIIDSKKIGAIGGGDITPRLFGEQ